MATNVLLLQHHLGGELPLLLRVLHLRYPSVIAQLYGDDRDTHQGVDVVKKGPLGAPGRGQDFLDSRDIAGCQGRALLVHWDKDRESIGTDSALYLPRMRLPLRLSLL